MSSDRRSLLVRLDGAESDAIGRDPVLTACLSFLERDMREHPERMRPFSEADIARISALTRDVTVSDEDVIPDDVTL